MARRRQAVSEEQHAADFILMCEGAKHIYPSLGWIFHVPNGGLRNRISAARLKAQGVKPGVPDFLLLEARGDYHGLAIELKRSDGGRLSDNQDMWLVKLQCAGYKTAVCHGALEAWDEAVAYARLPKWGGP